VVNLCLQGSLLKVVESATRVSQNNKRAVLYTRCHALITRELLIGTPLREAIKTAANTVAVEGELGKELGIAIESVFAMLDKEVREVTAQYGTGSSLESCLPAALHCALKHEKDLHKAFMETANAGGDCAARASLIGTWLGALHGMQSIPAKWQNELTAKDQIERCVEKIVAKLAK
jgi:ADP-ribosylglycohydrolase